MKKTGLLIFFSALVLGLSYNVAMGLSTPDYPYYECPSMERFSPLMNVSLYCMRPTPLKPSEFKKCSDEYKELYSKPKAEYRHKECKPSNVRYTQIAYGVSTCRVDFSLKPNPIIYAKKGANDTEERCIQKLKTALKKAYPNIEEEEIEE